eukprot:XP_028342003.1 FERM domain-containing protein 4A-like isoform X1 [Physeter catodon]
MAYYSLIMRGHLNWLQLDRRVLEHDFPKKSGPVVLYFCVRFYIESISYLKDNATIELFFLNAKSCIYKELIDVDSEVVFELASYILQVSRLPLVFVCQGHTQKKEE